MAWFYRKPSQTRKPWHWKPERARQADRDALLRYAALTQGRVSARGSASG